MDELRSTTGTATTATAPATAAPHCRPMQARSCCHGDAIRSDHPDLDPIACNNDAVAFAVLHALRTHAKPILEDIGAIGVDAKRIDAPARALLETLSAEEAAGDD